MTKREMKLDPNYHPEAKAFLDKMLLHIPGVQGSKAFGYPAYKINGKVFAFVGKNGIAVKLPQERVRELVAQGGAMRPFEPAEGIVWREWVSVQLKDPALYRNYERLLEESIQFVAGSLG
jgi:predicted DNA-binding protein (MmcQ/YjbR family)